jgi:hypothetical protein
MANGIRGGRNTVWARRPLQRAGIHAMHLGFSDRAVVYLNGPRSAGDDSYRSRDYRFLGSIGWYDTVCRSRRATTTS